jgi:hypothetical protein
MKNCGIVEDGIASCSQALAVEGVMRLKGGGQYLEPDTEQGVGSA